ncbi:MAG: DUF433 domain-containing protein [Caldilinea sp. CFX5]|nr:DUF433 domain-containing protein [Caldilinea sp. CFX5]
MAFVIQNDPVPLQVEANSGLRIGKSHIFLDSVVAAYKQGATAEEIVWQFPALPLADVYAVLSYYLRHTAEIEAYLAQQSFAALEPAELAANGHSQKSNHPMMALANLGECADPTVAARAKEILAQELDHIRGWSVGDGSNS